jgi:hypothetical protein
MDSVETHADQPWAWKPGMHTGLRFPFPGAESLETNHSQAWQDIFVLSILEGLSHGSYLEIGANSPFDNNNTALLASDLAWTGVSIEFDPAFVVPWLTERPDDRLVIADALSIDYHRALPMWFDSELKRVDYLQLDIDPSFNTLEALKRLPLDEIRFSVITFETDAYAGDLRAREESREILNRYGYELVAPDVNVLFPPLAAHPIPFEDWWVDPEVVDHGRIRELRALTVSPLMPQDILFG